MTGQNKEKNHEAEIGVEPYSGPLRAAGRVDNKPEKPRPGWMLDDRPENDDHWSSLRNFRG